MEMHDAAVSNFKNQDAAILCAAVADYRPEITSDRKIKRNGEELTLTLVPNPDIAAELGSQVKDNQILVGFALETDDEENNALLKIKKKNLDFIVLNSLKDNGAGFRTDTNKITIIDNKGIKKSFELKTKKEVAKDIIDELSLKINDNKY